MVEGVFKIGFWQVFLKDLHNHSYHFSNLMVHEALTKQLKPNKVLARIRDKVRLHLNYISFSRRIFCLQASTVIVEIVGTFKLGNNSTDFFKVFLLGLTCVEPFVGGDIFVNSTPSHLPNIKSLGN